jgi:hypothetical protein
MEVSIECAGSPHEMPGSSFGSSFRNTIQENTTGDFQDI